MTVHAAGRWPSARADGRTRQDLSCTALPARYVASEESALVQFLNGGPAKPTFTPPRPYEKGVAKRPTLINNVETLANVALIARHGAGVVPRGRRPRASRAPSWSPSPGRGPTPGARDRDRPHASTRSWPSAGVAYEHCQAVLVGGYFGTWLSPAQAHRLPLTHDALRAVGGAVGAGIVIGLPRDSCGLAETSRVAAYLAAHNAGQCGPCFNGLPAIAGALQRLAFGPWDERLAGPLVPLARRRPRPWRLPSPRRRRTAGRLRPAGVRRATSRRTAAAARARASLAAEPFLPVPGGRDAQGPWR